MLKALNILKHPLILNKTLKLRREIYSYISPLDVSVATKEEPFLPEDGVYRNIKSGKTWGKPFVSAQFHVKGTVPSSYDRSELAILADVGGEGQLYNEANEPTVALTNRTHTALDFIQAHKGKTLINLSDVTSTNKIDFFIDAGYNGNLPLFPLGKGKFKGVHLVKINAKVKEFYYDYLNLVYQYLAEEKSVDFSKLDKAYNLFFENKFDEAKSVINSIVSAIKTKDFTLYAVGHSHLDLAWLWPIRETKRKAVRTFCNQINNIEKYPFYNYGVSQPQQLAWIKEKYPNFFEIIKQKVKENRIEIQGGMWVESDINLASGEALIRQIHYGQQFWKENFDKTSTICWLPDVFGYSGSLPQILKKCDINNFMTIKLSWNEVNKFPYNTFNWSGIDGSTVLVHMPSTGSYNSEGTAYCIKKAIENNNEKHIKKGLFLFGAGDGGGGASEAQLEVISRQANYKRTNLKFSCAEDFFSDIRAENYKLPSYTGELYLEKHQGTFTTQSKIKYYNRHLESLLQIAEVICTNNYIKNGDYPSELFDQIWKEVLLYQFHDILPGSSINRVNTECVARYKILEKQILDLINETAAKLGGKGGYFNNSPLSINTTIIDNKECIKLVAKPYSTCTKEIVKVGENNIKYAENLMENSKISIDFDANGSFTLFDKTLDKELGTYNKMVLYKDPHKWYNAWDINENYYKKCKRHFKAINITTEIIGNIIIRKQLLKNSSGYVKQTIILRENSSTIEIENIAKINGIFRMLRMDSLPTFWSDEATFDIQFGNLKRSTKEDNSIEKAQFEVCAHKYVDVSDDTCGVAVINNCKYGHRVKNGVISVNLIRKPIYPDKKADCGEHTFKLAIMPHKGALMDSLVISEAYLLNRTPTILNCDIAPLFDATSNIVIETIKKGNMDNTVAIRCYEPLGKAVTASIKPNFTYASVQETNMLEVNGIAVDLSKIEFGKFEIKTLVFFLK